MGGTLPGAEALGNQKAEKKRRSILNAAMEANSRTQQQAIDATMGEAQQMRPEARLQAMQDAEGQVAGQLQRDLAGATTLATPTAGRTSDAYQQALMTREAGEADRTSALVRELARVRSLGNVQTDAALRRSNMAEALQSMWGSANNRSRAAELDANSVAPPWWAQAAGIGRKAATAYALGGM